MVIVIWVLFVKEELIFIIYNVKVVNDVQKNCTLKNLSILVKYLDHLYIENMTQFYVINIGDNKIGYIQQLIKSNKLFINVIIIVHITLIKIKKSIFVKKMLEMMDGIK